MFATSKRQLLEKIFIGLLAVIGTRKAIRVIEAIHTHRSPLYVVTCCAGKSSELCCGLRVSVIERDGFYRLLMVMQELHWNRWNTSTCLMVENGIESTDRLWYSTTFVHSRLVQCATRTTWLKLPNSGVISILLYWEFQREAWMRDA